MQVFIIKMADLTYAYASKKHIRKKELNANA